MNEGIVDIAYTQSVRPVDICFARLGFFGKVGVLYAIDAITGEICTHGDGPWTWNTIEQAKEQIRKWR